jgi:O-antigen ligase
LYLIQRGFFRAQTLADSLAFFLARVERVRPAQSRSVLFSDARRRDGTFSHGAEFGDFLEDFALSGEEL